MHLRSYPIFALVIASRLTPNNTTNIVLTPGDNHSPRHIYIDFVQTKTEVFETGVPLFELGEETKTVPKYDNLTEKFPCMLQASFRLLEGRRDEIRHETVRFPISNLDDDPTYGRMHFSTVLRL